MIWKGPRGTYVMRYHKMQTKSCQIFARYLTSDGKVSEIKKSTVNLKISELIQMCH